VTAGLAGQNAQAGATAAENEVLNNSLGDHGSEEQKDEDELKKEMSELDSKLPGYGRVIIGTDEEGEPEYAYKPPASWVAGGGTTGNSQGASGNTAPAGGGSAFDVDVGNGANDWSENATNSVATPYGPALQSNAPTAINAIGRCNKGRLCSASGRLVKVRQQRHNSGHCKIL